MSDTTTDQDIEKKQMRESEVKDARITLGEQKFAVLFVRGMSEDDITRLFTAARSALPDALFVGVNETRPGVSSLEMSKRCMTRTATQEEIDAAIAEAKEIVGSAS